MSTQLLTLLVLACSATAHLVLTCVTALYSRHRVQYLCLAWVNGIFTAELVFCAFFSDIIAEGRPGILHPLMLLASMTLCFLQSIFPLSIPMPGFLQWGRMWKYAQPAILLIAVYAIAALLGARFIHIDSAQEISENLLSSDMLLRLAVLGTCIYYIINIFRLPHRIAHNTSVPRYMLGYCFALGLSVIYYVMLSIFYSPQRVIFYIIIFTLLNLYLTFRTLETMARNLPKPIIKKVTEAPTVEQVEQTEKDDFNEANLQRFQRIQFWMQNHPEEWLDNTFGRDRLCEQVGYNRHLVLQCVRSQGYNNVHDYITYYRINELKHMIQRGRVTSVSEALDAGFGSAKTARSCFEKIEGISLDEYLAQHKGKKILNV